MKKNAHNTFVMGKNRLQNPLNFSIIAISTWLLICSNFIEIKAVEK